MGVVRNIFVLHLERLEEEVRYMLETAHKIASQPGDSYFSETVSVGRHGQLVVSTQTDDSCHPDVIVGAAVELRRYEYGEDRDFDPDVEYRAALNAAWNYREGHYPEW